MSDEPSRIAQRRAVANRKRGDTYGQRKQIILDAAAELFRIKGVERTSLDDIGKAIGKDRASIYYYYSSKQDLLHDLLGTTVQKNVEDAEAIAAQAGPAPEKLRMAIITLMNSYVEHYPYLFIFINEDLTSRQVDDGSWWMEKVRTWGRRYDRAIRSIVEEGMEAGTIQRVASATVVSNAIVGMLNSASGWYSARPGADSAKVGDALADIVLLGLDDRPRPRRRPKVSAQEN
jgi:AcrR family transcriptional regulator